MVHLWRVLLPFQLPILCMPSLVLLSPTLLVHTHSLSAHFNFSKFNTHKYNVNTVLKTKDSLGYYWHYVITNTKTYKPVTEWWVLLESQTIFLLSSSPQSSQWIFALQPFSSSHQFFLVTPKYGNFIKHMRRKWEN